MKKFFIFLVCFTLFAAVSCGDGNGGDPEEISDIPDWDYSNVVSDEEKNDTGDTSTDSGSSDTTDSADSADSGTVQPGDTGDSGDSGDSGSNENQLPQGCGNGKVDYNERCDSEVPVICSSLNANMTDKAVTKCLSDCTAYDMAACDRKDKAWGVVNISFRTDFILDSTKLNNSDYFAQGALPYAAFNGLYGDEIKFFPVFGDGSTSVAVTTSYSGTLGANRRQLFIRQSPASGYPRHELEFAPGGIKKGNEYRIDAITTYQLIDNLLKLVRYRLIDNQNGQECILGIGYSGTVKVNSIDPENVELFEGGKIDVVVNDLDFYYPTEIPGRNAEEDPVPDEILKYPLCPSK